MVDEWKQLGSEGLQYRVIFGLEDSLELDRAIANGAEVVKRLGLHPDNWDDLPRDIRVDGVGITRGFHRGHYGIMLSNGAGIEYRPKN